MRYRLAVVAVVTLLCAGVLFAGSGTPLIAIFLNNGSTYGVSGDGQGSYSNGVDRVQVYFGAGGGNVDLITYSTKRKLVMSFNPASAPWQASGLAQTVPAEVDLYGVNYYGLFSSMGIGTTAQVHTSLQFKGGTSTYELDYPALAAMRLDANTWLITSNPADIPGFPGFTASSTASLGRFRKTTRTTFGNVSMPIRFQVVLK